jgi:DNA polymerase-4
VAATKFLAKVASGVAKPDGLLVVDPARELSFLHPLSVERLWGVGPKTAARLHGYGLYRVADVAALAEETLVEWLGPAQGRRLFALAQNRDPRPVQPRRRRRSIGAQRALGPRSRPFPEIVSTLMGLDRVKDRFGSAAVTRGSLLGQSLGDGVPILHEP